MWRAISARPYEEALLDYAVVKRAFPRHKGVLAEIEEAETLTAKARAAGRACPLAPSVRWHLCQVAQIPRINQRRCSS